VNGEGDTRYAKVPRPPGASRYGWFVAVVIFLALAYITINTSRTHPQSSTGVKSGNRMPPFAVPLALSALDGDANIATKPNQKGAGRHPACQLRGPRILNICQLYERGPVALAFFATRGAQCETELDRLQDLQRSFPTIGMAAVAIRGDRDDVRRDVRRHGWRFPVGYDHDGVLANLYGVAVCPQITLADRGGRVVKNLIVARQTQGLALRRELRALARRAE